MRTVGDDEVGKISRGCFVIPPAACCGALQHHNKCYFFFTSRRRHTRFDCDLSSDVCSSDLDRRRQDLAPVVEPGRDLGPVERRPEDGFGDVLEEPVGVTGEQHGLEALEGETDQHELLLRSRRGGPRPPRAAPGGIVLQARLRQRSARREPRGGHELRPVAREREDLELEARLARERRAPVLQPAHESEHLRSGRGRQPDHAPGRRARRPGHDRGRGEERARLEVGRDPGFAREVLLDPVGGPDAREGLEPRLDLRRVALDDPRVARGIDQRQALAQRGLEAAIGIARDPGSGRLLARAGGCGAAEEREHVTGEPRDRKSTRLNSSHSQISYAVSCLEKKPRLYPSLREVDAYLGWFGPASRVMQAMSFLGEVPGVRAGTQKLGERFVKGSTGGPGPEARAKSGSLAVAEVEAAAGSVIERVELLCSKGYTYPRDLHSFPTRRSSD